MSRPIEVNSYDRQHVSSSLGTFSLAKIEQYNAILGFDRIKQYKENRYNMEIVYQFFSGTIDLRRIEPTLANLIGFEFNVYLIELLRSMETPWIDVEQDIGTTRIDAVAVLNVINIFTVIQLDMNEKQVCLPDEIHTFEAKCTRKVPYKAIRQIKRARGHYHNCHVLVLADTYVCPKMNRRIRNAGGDILRASIRRDDIIKRLEDIKNRFAKVG